MGVYGASRTCVLYVSGTICSYGKYGATTYIRNVCTAPVELSVHHGPAVYDCPSATIASLISLLYL